MIKKLMALCLVATLTITSFTSCSKNNKDTETNVQIGVNGYVYTPEYVELPDEESNSSIQNLDIQKNNIYYSVYSWDEKTGESKNTYYKKALVGNAEAEELSISLDNNSYVTKMVFGQNEELYLVLNKYEEATSSLYLEKYDAQGNQIFSNDITKLFDSERGMYIDQVAVDSNGKIALSTDQKIYLFDANGQSKGEMVTTSWINTLCVDNKDNFYAVQSGQEGMELALIDFEAKTFTNTYKNIPYSQTIIAGEDNDFMICTDSTVYKYSLETQTSEKVFDWLDSDINGQNIQGFSMLEDGRFAVYTQAWNGQNNNTELVLLTKTQVDDVPSKEIIVIGTLNQNQNLQREAVNFNKSNDKYRIKIKTYIDDSTQGGENRYEDAITLMNNDMVLNDGPDIINISSDINIQNLADKGIFVDLSSFLEKSSAFKKEDFLDNIIKSFTFNDSLVTIPSRFYINVALAKSSIAEEFGAGIGWSVNELIAYSKENPEIQIFDYRYNTSMLNRLMTYNQDGFIDYEKGKCNFDSDEFKSILELANELPSPNFTGSMSSSEEKNLPYRLQDNELLINDTTIHTVDEFQMYKLMFNEPSINVGYPTTDGSYLGSVLNVAGSSYAISSKSKNQEAAWAFIESVLLGDDGSDRGFYYGFPTQKVLLDQIFEKAITPNYILDENGEKILNEDGTPMISPHSWQYGSDWEAEIDAATQEEVDELREILVEAQLALNIDNQVLSIILEEVEPYFQGQKSLEDVVTVIQSRVQLYVSENN